MIIKVEKDRCTQKCQCGELKEFVYTDLIIKEKVIALTPCLKCGALEFLLHNNQEDKHSIMVAKIFANIAIQE